MSHELTERANGFFEFAYCGEPGWHGHGQEVQPGAPLEGPNGWEVSAGMDWKIQRSKVRYFADREGAQQLEMPEQNVLFRSDTKAALGLVSARFKVVQPRTVLKSMHDLCGELGFTMETAGTLFGGKKFWSLARIGETAMILDRDPVSAFLLLVTSCDGSSKTKGKYVITRAVCNNTVTAGLAEGGKETAVSHRSDFNWSAVKDSLGIVHGSFGRYVEQMRALTAIKVGRDVAETLVHGLLRPGETDVPELMDKRAPRGFSTIMDLFNGSAKGSTIPGVRGTAWALLNSITEYADHHATTKTDSHRLDSAWFGNGDDLKTAAFNRLLAMA